MIREIKVFKKLQQAELPPILLYNCNVEKSYYVYILLTEDNTLYCGYTDDVERRFKLHQEGKGAKYTRSHRPVKIVYTKRFETKSEAQKEEYRIKQLPREEKLKLIT